MVTTPNRLYPLQATGSNVGTWGTVQNNQIFGVIDLNLGGRYNVDVSGSTDITLTSTNAENIYHHLTGTLTGNINYIFPAGSGGDYVINNGTSGAFTITVKISGGTGLLVPQGSALRVFIDPDAGAAVSGGSIAIVSGGGLEYSNNALRRSALTGDVTASAGSNATTIANNAVTGAKIADGGVASAKLASTDLQAYAALATTGLVARTGAGTATTRAITQGTNIQVANGDGVAGAPTLTSTATTPNTQNASYTLVLTDAGKVIEMLVGTANTLTVPPNSSVAFPIGTFINFTQAGAGQTTITPGSGVTLNNANGLKTNKQNSMGTMYKSATDTWYVGGDMTT